MQACAEHQANVLAVVPVMLQRILELPEEAIDRYDLAALKIIAASGSALPGELAKKVMDRFGDVLYNLYGSTEVGLGDDRDARGHARRARHRGPPAARDDRAASTSEESQELPAGETGRIFVGNEMLFEGYTGGGGKDVIDGLMATGDVGHFDDGGRLFVDGRDDEMIVSGGENVFPREVEDLLHDHDAIDEAAVIGVPDEKFGQRLKAFVVVTSGKSEALRERAQGPRQGQPRALQGAARDRLHGRAAAQRHRQGAQARAGRGGERRRRREEQGQELISRAT